MPIPIKEIKDYQKSVILSSTKEDLEKLTDIELTTISDILSKRKNDGYIQPRTQELLEIAHYLMMQDSDRERKQAEAKENSQKFPNVLFSLLRNWNFIMGNPGYYTAGKKISMKEFDETCKRGHELDELRLKKKS